MAFTLLPAFSLKTPPTFEPVSFEQAKEHFRKTDNEEDALIASYLSAARQWVEAETGRALCTQTWQLSIDRFVKDLWLPRAAPLQSLTFVKYYDADNVLQTWNASNYTTPAFEEPARLRTAANVSVPSVYDREDAVQVEYVVGYAAGACPEGLQLAVMTLAAHFHENREAVLVGSISKEYEFAVTALCDPYRVIWRPPCL